VEDLVPEEETMLILTQGGYVKRIKPTEYRTQKRGGKGVIGVTTKDEDVPLEFISGSTHAGLLFFTNSGKIFETKMYEIPEGTRQSKGKSISNFLSLSADEKVTAVLAVPKEKKGLPANKQGEKNFVILVTQQGIIKKVSAQDFSDVRRSGIKAINLKKGDSLYWAKIVAPGEEILISSSKGKAIRFKEKDARVMGRSAQGVRAIKLKKGDEVVGMDVIPREAKKLEVLAVSELGYGKKTSLTQYKVQKRSGSGVKTVKVTPKTGNLISAQIVWEDKEELIAISNNGQVIRIELNQIPTLSRATQGVRIMKLESGDKVASVVLL
jgi:DNA gyrase subunit A